ncbi:MAG: DUF1552 domain-containing protein [Pirellulaceae bacterium]|nr:DUF1552 domain-containing protein [Pirellulaceae bacterium]
MSVSRLERRTFLKGLGLSLGLPMLEAMRPESSAKAAPANQPPVRMAFVFFPNGAIMPSWTPSETGENYKLSKTLEPLADFKGDMNVLTGLAQDNGRAKGDGAGDHARCASSYLTGAHPYKTSGADIRVGVSVDQAAAQKVGHLTKLPSLELGIEKGRNAGNCDSGYSCAYSSNVSWKSATTPMAKEIHPRLVFERLFGDAKQSEEGRERRDFYRKSVLDFVANDADKLKAKLGITDRRKLDEYFSSVRDLERRVVRAEQEAERVRPDFEVPDGIPRDYQQHVRLMFDLMVLAFRTDTTRIATFMLGNAGSNRSYRMVGVSDGHHQLSHHRDKKELIDKIQKIDGFLVGEFAYFLRKLKSEEEGSGTLLDNSLIMYGSGLSDGNRHHHHNLPVVLAGRGGGTIRTGRHISTGGEMPLNNLFLSLLDRVGADVERVGDSSGRLTVLDA